MNQEELKQRLIELLLEYDQMRMMRMGIKECADHLIANGVTIRERGEWVKTEAYPHRVYCSVCYKTYVTNEDVIQGRSWGHPTYCMEADFCPHCGADMRGGKDE